jgi:hypothetical protein
VKSTRYLIAAFGTLLLLALAAPAQAIPPGCEDPEDCPPEEIQHTSTLTVNPPAQGNIGGPGINCGAGGDCSESFSWSETCIGFGPGRECTENGDVEDPVLTATGGPAGYAPSWSGCTSVSEDRKCTVHMNAAHTVSMTWIDITAPTVGLSMPASVVGPATVFTASAADNSGSISKVDFYVDGAPSPAGTDTAAPFQFAPNLALYGHGTAHTLQAIAQDGSGHRSVASPTSPHGFTIDKQTGLNTLSTPPGNVTSAPSIDFAAPADISDAGVTCTTRFGGAPTGSTSDCGSPYAPQLGGSPTDGLYTVEFRVEDKVGNIAIATRTFTLDRGAPNLDVTSPAGGAIVGAPFTPAVTVSDGFTAEDDILVECKIGNGAFGSCDALAPADGARTLTVRATDLAGNAAEDTVAFTYDASAPVVAITAGPGEGSVVYARGASFAFTATDLTAVARSCKLDGGAFGACTSATGHTLSGLGLGIHTFVLRVTDAAGHVTMVQRRFTVADRPTDTGGTTTSSSPPPPPPPPPTPPTEPQEIVNATLSSGFKAFRGYTRYSRLVLKRVPKGATVAVTCKGKKCPAKRFTSKRSGNVKLAKFAKKKLRAGTTLTIRVTKPGAIGKQFVITIRRGKVPKLRISQIA